MTNVSTEMMNVVIVGHVDHGKSTLIGRLMADTGSLPQGKLEAVRRNCERNAKPFEYAFLLDALKDEQSQGITIDVARCFFKTAKRHYIIIDAPGHIEFLKNMITGAARAEAALLVIDAKEGVQENSRRHGYMAAMLGIKQLVVLVNKMDLANYDQAVFERIKSEYTAFLNSINVEPIGFIPISAFNGVNLTQHAAETPWYTGPTVLSALDAFSHVTDVAHLPFRMPVQDIYKFTESGDDRRIFAGTIESGAVSVGDDVTFLPSGKRSTVKSIEGFNLPAATQIAAGRATGFQLNTQIYVKPGELMVKTGDAQIQVGDTFRANIFWLGKNPLVKGKRYKLKISATRSPVYVSEIVTVLNAAELSAEDQKTSVERHEVAECMFQCPAPIAYDLSANFEGTGRFVIIDDYEIAGGGIITETLNATASLTDQFVAARQQAWLTGAVSNTSRNQRFRQKPKMVMITGPANSGKSNLARQLEQALFLMGQATYYLGVSDAHAQDPEQSSVLGRDDLIHKVGEFGHLLTDSGLLFVTSVSDLTDDERRMIQSLIAPFELILVAIGNERLLTNPDVTIPIGDDLQYQVSEIKRFLFAQNVIADFVI